jgi:hypothetical protein
MNTKSRNSTRPLWTSASRQRVRAGRAPNTNTAPEAIAGMCRQA